MGTSKNINATAGRLASALVVACLISLADASAGVDSICASTNFESTCKETLANASAVNPKELLKTSFNAAIENIHGKIKQSILMAKKTTDKRTQDALAVCEEVLNTTIEDLNRSSDKVDSFEITRINDYLDDVKVWLSAGLTCKDTCIDSFDNTTTDTGGKIKQMLESTGELLSNSLAIIDNVSKFFDKFDFGTLFSKRRLLGQEASLKLDNSKGKIPSFVNQRARNLLARDTKTLTPNVTVALDGSGQFKTIGEAVDSAPLKSNDTYVILIKAGVYKEIVMIPKKKNNVVFLGEGPNVTRISGDKSFHGGFTTFHTSTLTINGQGFMAKDIGIENTAGAIGHQAVAVRVSGDKAVFYNVHIEGYQDTLYAHMYRQFYRDCKITGTIDFIFGNAIAIFQNCELVTRKPLSNQGCMVTAQGRTDSGNVGITLIQNCSFTAEKELLESTPPVMAYLGRPWKNYSRTIIMQSNIDGFMSPDGWAPWSGTFGLDTLYYGEYGNRGPGADQSKRVKWIGIQKMTPDLAESFTLAKLFAGEDDWLKNTGVPYSSGMMDIPLPPPMPPSPAPLSAESPGSAPLSAVDPMTPSFAPLSAMAPNSVPSSAPLPAVGTSPTPSSAPLPAVGTSSTPSSAPLPAVGTSSTPSSAPLPAMGTSSTPSFAPIPSMSTSSTPSSAPLPMMGTSSTPSSTPLPTVGTSSAPSSAPLPAAGTSSTPSSAPLPGMGTSSTPSSAPLPGVGTSSTPSSAPLPDVGTGSTPLPAVDTGSTPLPTLGTTSAPLPAVEAS